MQVSPETQRLVIEDIERQAHRIKMTVSKPLKLYEISRSTFYGWTGEETINNSGSRFVRISEKRDTKWASIAQFLHFAPKY